MIIQLAQKIQGCFEHPEQAILIEDLAKRLEAEQEDINLAVDWLVQNGFGVAWFVQDTKKGEK